MDKKQIKANVREALGVPNGVLDVAKEVYSRMMNTFKSTNGEPNEGNITHSFEFRDAYIINDFEFNRIDLNVNVIHTNKVDHAKIFSLAFHKSARAEPNSGVLIAQRNNTVEIAINIGSPEYDEAEIYKLLVTEKSELLSSLSHEFKHAYDNHKNNIEKMTTRAEYKTFNGVRFGVKPIDDFLHMSYYVHGIENLVRPSEVAMDMEFKEVKKSDFIKFLTTNRVYLKLKEVQDFSYGKLKSELLTDIDKLRSSMIKNEVDIEGYDDEKVIDTFLSTIFERIQSIKVDNLRQMLGSSIFNFSSFFGDGLDDKIIVDYKKKLAKFKTHDQFFQYEEKLFKIISNKMIKKISKLYDMAKNDTKVADVINKIHGKEVNVTNESIIDWDLHYDANKIPTTRFKK
jgi:hypothetical protein